MAIRKEALNAIAQQMANRLMQQTDIGEAPAEVNEAMVAEAVYANDVVEETESNSGTKVYQTTEGNYIVQDNDGNTFRLDGLGKPFTGTDEQFGLQSKRLRSGSQQYDRITKVMHDEKKKRDKLVFVDTIKGFTVYMNKDDYVYYIEIDGELHPFSRENAQMLRTATRELEKIKLEMTPSDTDYHLGDRVMMYGPTGTGKTFEFLQTANGMMARGEISAYDIITVTDGFEDIDFLAHIVPGENGITYVENKIVTLLREASEGKKVAILIDELNRGSKSLLNLILKLLDPVDGATYVLNNFVKNETIVIPMENVMFFATMNLGGKYVGTNVLDEALFDRFNIVMYKGYSEVVEDAMLNSFGAYKSQVREIVSYIRVELHKEGEIRAPISTRGVKMWAEAYINSGCERQDVVNTFSRVILNRLISVDDYGNPNEEEIGLILNKFRSLSLM